MFQTTRKNSYRRDNTYTTGFIYFYNSTYLFLFSLSLAINDYNWIASSYTVLFCTSRRCCCGFRNTIGYGRLDYVGTSLLTLCSCGLPIEKNLSVPTSRDSSPPQTGENTLHLVLLLLLPVIWFCMNTSKIAKNKLFLWCVCTHLQMCIP